MSTGPVSSEVPGEPPSDGGAWPSGRSAPASTRAVERAMGLLGEVCAEGEITLSQCARRARLPVSTALRLLRTLETSGFVRLTNCQVGSDDGNIPIGDATVNGVDISTFLFAYHGMAVGPFGTSALGRYTAE